MMAGHLHRSFPLSARVGRQWGRAALSDLDGDGTIAALDQHGLPQINPDGLLPDIYVDLIVQAAHLDDFLAVCSDRLEHNGGASRSSPQGGVPPKRHRWPQGPLLSGPAFTEQRTPAFSETFA